MIASTRLAKAQRAMASGKEYGLANAEVFAHSQDDTQAKKRLFLVVSSDKGLCGGIHSSVSKATRRAIGNQSDSPLPAGSAPVDAASPIVVIGDKSKAQLSRAVGGNLVLTFNQIGREVPTFADAASVADLVVKSGVEYDEVVLVYNKFLSAVSYEAAAQVVLGENAFKESGESAYFSALHSLKSLRCLQGLRKRGRCYLRPCRVHSRKRYSGCSHRISCM